MTLAAYVIPYSAAEDYTAVSETLTFDIGTNRTCSPVSIVDDSTVEDTEEFSVVLISDNFQVDVTTPSEASVIILDGDGRCIVMEQCLFTRQIQIHSKTF